MTSKIVVNNIEPDAGISSVTVNGGLTVTGVLKYEDVTNVDSVGVITAREGIKIPDNKYIKIGSSDDLQIYHAAGAASHINNTGLLNIDGTTGVRLEYNNSTRVDCTTSGVSLVGDVDVADKIIHTGDTNTMIRFPAADTITAETGGTERLRIKSDGNIEVGGNLKTNNISGKNLVINGSFQVDQRNNGSELSITNNTLFSADRWTHNNDGFTYYKTQRKNDASIQTIGTEYYMRVTVTTAVTLSGSTSQCLENNLEGNTVRWLNLGTSAAKQCTISFWVRCSLTGTFGGALVNAAYNRCHPFSYTVSSANTWEYKTFTFTTTGFTSGGMTTDTGVGIRLVFSVGNGPGRQASADQWHSSVKFGPTGETNLVATNGATMDIASVQLEEGTQATRFDHKSYAEELRLCERYYQIIMKEGNGWSRSGGLGGTPYSNGSTVYCPCIFPTEMRAKPTIISSGSGSFRSRLANNNSFNGFSGANDHNRKGATFMTTGLSSGSVGQYHWIETDSNALLALSAEL